jgi:16S rRNA (uracil1498-N3)-methyltransferase
MSLPYFYIDQLDISQKEIVLDEETSSHIVQVLRMKAGEKLQLTDGKGNLATGNILDSHKKHCTVQIEATHYQQPITKKVSIAISLVKNTSRFEWFLEKATEVGITEIIPLVCERTIKEKFRFDRMKGICVSAMLQSQQSWLPLLHQPIAFDLLFQQEELKDIHQKFIAHCEQGNKQSITRFLHSSEKKTDIHSLVLIGPEGDFSSKEIELALQHQFIPVSLGETRLRTETAGIVAATLLQLS